jgi:hypothetical protein
MLHIERAALICRQVCSRIIGLRLLHVGNDERQRVMADEERQYFIVLYQVFKNGAGRRHKIRAEVLQSSIIRRTGDCIRPAMETDREGQG